MDWVDIQFRYGLPLPPQGLCRSFSSSHAAAARRTSASGHSARGCKWRISSGGWGWWCHA